MSEIECSDNFSKSMEIVLKTRGEKDLNEDDKIEEESLKKLKDYRD